MKTRVKVNALGLNKENVVDLKVARDRQMKGSVESIVIVDCITGNFCSKESHCHC
ncbi:MAG: hypothetical protein ACEPOW_03890 [Bacteroidales bacterium]